MQVTVAIKLLHSKVKLNLLCIAAWYLQHHKFIHIQFHALLKLVYTIIKTGLNSNKDKSTGPYSLNLNKSAASMG